MLIGRSRQGGQQHQHLRGRRRRTGEHNRPLLHGWRERGGRWEGGRGGQTWCLVSDAHITWRAHFSLIHCCVQFFWGEWEHFIITITLFNYHMQQINWPEHYWENLIKFFWSLWNNKTFTFNDVSLMIHGWNCTLILIDQRCLSTY